MMNSIMRTSIVVFMMLMEMGDVANASSPLKKKYNLEQNGKSKVCEHSYVVNYDESQQKFCVSSKKGGRVRADIIEFIGNFNSFVESNKYLQISVRDGLVQVIDCLQRNVGYLNQASLEPSTKIFNYGDFEQDLNKKITNAEAYRSVAAEMKTVGSGSGVIDEGKEKVGKEAVYNVFLKKETNSLTDYAIVEFVNMGDIGPDIVANNEFDRNMLYYETAFLPVLFREFRKSKTVDFLQNRVLVYDNIPWNNPQKNEGIDFTKVIATARPQKSATLRTWRDTIFFVMRAAQKAGIKSLFFRVPRPYCSDALFLCAVLDVVHHMGMIKTFDAIGIGVRTKNELDSLFDGAQAFWTINYRIIMNKPTECRDEPGQLDGNWGKKTYVDDIEGYEKSILEKDESTEGEDNKKSDVKPLVGDRDIPDDANIEEINAKKLKKGVVDKKTKNKQHVTFSFGAEAKDDVYVANTLNRITWRQFETGKIKTPKNPRLKDFFGAIMRARKQYPKVDKVFKEASDFGSNNPIPFMGRLSYLMRNGKIDVPQILVLPFPKNNKMDTVPQRFHFKLLLNKGGSFTKCVAESPKSKKTAILVVSDPTRPGGSFLKEDKSQCPNCAWLSRETTILPSFLKISLDTPKVDDFYNNVYFLEGIQSLEDPTISTDIFVVHETIGQKNSTKMPLEMKIHGAIVCACNKGYDNLIVRIPEDPSDIFITPMIKAFNTFPQCDTTIALMFASDKAKSQYDARLEAFNEGTTPKKEKIIAPIIAPKKPEPKKQGAEAKKVKDDLIRRRQEDDYFSPKRVMEDKNRARNLKRFNFELDDLNKQKPQIDNNRPKNSQKRSPTPNRARKTEDLGKNQQLPRKTKIVEQSPRPDNSPTKIEEDKDKNKKDPRRDPRGKK